MVRGIDAGLPVFRILPLDQVMRDATWNPRVSATLFNSLTLIAVCLATVGLYAVTSYSVVRRTHELGLRMALGARARHVMWLVLRGSGGHIAAGLALGLGCTVVWERLFGSSAGSAATSLADPSVLATITGILAAVAVLACAWPASRAIRVNPVEALREG
ncbi:MAG: FtsX-like permease family protein [Vicinamibacterales bacterium]